MAPPLQVRLEPTPPTKHEQAILDLLWKEYRKSDTVARAAARFEADVHAQLVQRRIAEGLSEDEAGEVSSVFRADEFNTAFRRLLQLRLEIQLLRKLGLQDYESDIVQQRIKAIFRSDRPVKRSVPITPDLQIGSPETQQIQDLKARGKARGRRRP